MIAPAVALALLLTAGAGTAAAQEQLAEQSAGTSQSADSNASSTQVNPTNSNITVRIGSPGNNGSVSQSNSSSAASAAGNAALTGQSASQSSGGGGVQGVLQDAYTDQSADSSAESTQIKPTNSNIDVRIGSPGDNGDVEQSNSSDATSFAGNIAKTEQVADQDQGGGKCCHGSGVQAAEQDADTKQDADSKATSKQIHPTNENTSVRIDKPHKGHGYGGYADGKDMAGGKNGSVTQSNDSSALSFAGNAAKTEQVVEQKQDGSCGCHGDLVQASGQWADTKQEADSDAESFQLGATNSNTPVRINSGGGDGDVDQSNSSEAVSFAGNLAFTGQAVEQEQSGDCKCPKSGKPDKYDDKRPEKAYGSSHCCSNGVQASGQWADTRQDADSDAESKQIKPTNSSAPVRIGSYGGGGSVSQSNSSFAKSKAFNLAATLQFLTQEQ
jgi:hypothetical protein